MTIRETDADYYRRRASEEADAAATAMNAVARDLHAELAQRYSVHAAGVAPGEVSVSGTFARDQRRW